VTRPVVALLTDFGLVDPFVGVMKAVIVARCPEVTLLDVTHAVPAQSIAEGAFWLERSFRWFPPGTVFVAVVDPGVGSARRAIVAEAHGRTFLGPDNGLLFPTLVSDPDARVHAIDPGSLGLPPPSATFHGRDVFAPVAADLAARRLSPSSVGPRVEQPVAGGFPRVTRRAGDVEGEVVTVDHFGNLITNVEGGPSPLGATVELGGAAVPLVRTYADANPGDLIALVNAFDVVEIAQRDGNAARALALGRGARVVLHPKP
jgi:S-adenosylmethionine hydrolase